MFPDMIGALIEVTREVDADDKDAVADEADAGIDAFVVVAAAAAVEAAVEAPIEDNLKELDYAYFTLIFPACGNPRYSACPNTILRA